MSLTPNAAWTLAAEQSPNELRLFLDIYDGTTTWTLLDKPSTADPPLSADIALLDVSAISAEVDPFTRAIQTGTIIVRVADAWARPLIVANRLKGQRIRIWLGFADLIGADYLRIFTGVITNVTPNPGANEVELECLDTFGQLELSKTAAYWLNEHPLTVVESILDGADIPAGLIDNAAFDPSDASNAAISHYVISRGPIWGFNSSTLEAYIRDPVPALDLCNEIAMLLNGNLAPNEDGEVTFNHFDAAAAAADHWDSVNVIGSFDQRPLDENVVNRISLSFSQTVAAVRFANRLERDDDDSVADFAYPGEAGRFLAERLETPWLDATWSWLKVDMPAAPGAGYTTMTILAGTTHAWTGVRWPSFARGGAPAQPADAKISAARPAYFMFEKDTGGEIVKCTTAAVVTTDLSTDLPIHLDSDGVADGYTREFPAQVTYTVARAQLGTAAVAHSGTAADGTLGAYVWDITIPLAMVTERLARFSYGAPVVEVTTPLSKAWLQQGDLVTLDHPDFVAYGYDGIVQGDGKFEIVLKEINASDPSPHIRWVLVWAGLGTPTYSQRMRGLAPSNGGTIQATEQEDVARPFVAGGLGMADGGGLTVDMDEGRIGSGTVTRQLPASTDTYRASVDTYITHEARTGARIFTETALGAGAPDLRAGETTIGKVVTDGAGVTSIDDSEKPTTAIDGDKLIDATVDTLQLAAAAVETAKLDDLAVTTGKIADTAVDNSKIDVEAVQTTNIRDRHVTMLKIDAVTFAAFRSGSNQSIPNKASIKVQFNSEDFDYGADYDNATNYRFTAPVAGVYSFTARALLLSVADTEYAYLELRVNGSLARSGDWAYNQSGGAANIPVVGSFGEVALGVGDYAEVWVYHNDTVARNLTYNSISDTTYFTGKQIR